MDILSNPQAYGYQRVKQLEDGTLVGTVDLIFTRALCIDIDPSPYGSWEHRYCYKDLQLADLAFDLYVDADKPPYPGFIAERHVGGGPLHQEYFQRTQRHG